MACQQFYDAENILMLTVSGNNLSGPFCPCLVSFLPLPRIQLIRYNFSVDDCLLFHS